MGAPEIVRKEISIDRRDTPLTGFSLRSFPPIRPATLAELQESREQSQAFLARWAEIEARRRARERWPRRVWYRVRCCWWPVAEWWSDNVAWRFARHQDMP